MSRSGNFSQKLISFLNTVLIPLLVDVPLWVYYHEDIPFDFWVLIPLLVDVPLWATKQAVIIFEQAGLNPSFSGCPALGAIQMWNKFSAES